MTASVSDDTGSGLRMINKLCLPSYMIDFVLIILVIQSFHVALKQIAF